MLSGALPGRTTDDEITLFKSVGIALEEDGEQWRVRPHLGERRTSGPLAVRESPGGAIITVGSLTTAVLPS